MLLHCWQKVRRQAGAHERKTAQEGTPFITISSSITNPLMGQSIHTCAKQPTCVRNPLLQESMYMSKNLHIPARIYLLALESISSWDNLLYSKMNIPTWSLNSVGLKPEFVSDSCRYTSVLRHFHHRRIERIN